MLNLAPRDRGISYTGVLDGIGCDRLDIGHVAVRINR